MLKIICDKCGKDAGSVGYDITVRVLSNPTPMSVRDSSDPVATHDSTYMRMTLCQKCYGELNFPNIYEVWRTRELTWKDNDKNGEEL